MLDPDAVAEAKHEEAVNYEKAIIELFVAADDDGDGSYHRPRALPAQALGRTLTYLSSAVTKQAS